MSLSKQKVQDKIEIVSAYKHIQIRYSNQILEDGVVISDSFERTVVSCGDFLAADEHNVRAIADAVWSAELIAAYEASIAPVVIEEVIEEPISEEAPAEDSEEVVE
jgi:predicted transcriptional regulator